MLPPAHLGEHMSAERRKTLSKRRTGTARAHTCATHRDTYYSLDDFGLRHGLELEAFTPALDVARGRRRKMGRADQGGGVAQAAEQLAARLSRLLGTVVDPHAEFRVARLQWR